MVFGRKFASALQRRFFEADATSKMCFRDELWMLPCLKGDGLFPFNRSFRLEGSIGGCGSGREISAIAFTAIVLDKSTGILSYRETGTWNVGESFVRWATLSNLLLQVAVVTNKIAVELFYIHCQDQPRRRIAILRWNQNFSKQPF